MPVLWPPGSVSPVTVRRRRPGGHVSKAEGAFEADCLGMTGYLGNAGLHVFRNLRFPSVKAKASKNPGPWLGRFAPCARTTPGFLTLTDFPPFEFRIHGV